MGRHTTRARKARRILDGAQVGQRNQRPNNRHAHHQSASRVVPSRHAQRSTQDRDLLTERPPCREQGVDDPGQVFVGIGNLHDTARETAGDPAAELHAEYLEKAAKLIIEHGALADQKAAGGKKRA